MQTAMCDTGRHGTQERRYARKDGKMDFSRMWEGTCAGTVYHLTTGKEEECSCTCHWSQEEIDSRLVEMDVYTR